MAMDQWMAMPYANIDTNACGCLGPFCHKSDSNQQCQSKEVSLRSGHVHYIHVLVGLFTVTEAGLSAPHATSSLQDNIVLSVYACMFSAETCMAVCGALCTAAINAAEHSPITVHSATFAYA